MEEFVVVIVSNSKVVYQNRFEECPVASKYMDSSAVVWRTCSCGLCSVLVKFSSDDLIGKGSYDVPSSVLSAGLVFG